MSELIVRESNGQPSRWIPTRAMAVKIAASYALLGGLWILISGWLVHHFVSDPALESLLENLKGWLFVLVTGLLLLLALERYFQAIRGSAQLLEASEQRWQLALKGAGQGVWDWNAQTNEVFYSVRWKRLLGFEPDEIGDTLSEWKTRIHPEDLPRVQTEIQRHLDGQTPMYSSEHRLRCKDGSFKWVLDQGKVLSHSPNGKPLRVLGTHSDITERKQAEQALKDSEARFRVLVENAPDAILVLLGRRLAYANAAALQMVGAKEAAEVVGQGVEERIHPDWRRVVEGRLQILIDERKPVPPMEQTYLRLDGSPLQVEVSAVPARWDNQHGAVVFVRDITVRKRLANVQAFLAHTAEQSEGFFRALARYLAECLEMNFVSIDLLRDNNLTAQPVAVYDDGKFQDNVSYALEGTPSGNVVAEGVCCFPRGVRALFPSHKLLQELQAESYAGTVLRGSGGRAIGLIAVVGSQPLRDPDLVQAVLQIVSGRAAIELERQQSKAQLRQWADAFEHCAHGLAIGLPDSNELIACNPAFAGMFGLKVSELNGTSVLNLYAPEDLERIPAAIAEANRVGQARFEARLLRGDGSTFPAQVDLVSVRDGGGKPLYRVATVQDITERRQSDQALRASEERFRTVVETAPEAIFIRTGNCFAYLNTAALRLFGASRPDELVGQPVMARFHPDCRDKIVDRMRMLDEQGRSTLAADMIYLKLDGSPVHVIVSAVPFTYQNQTSALVFARDITERKQAETVLRESLLFRRQAEKIGRVGAWKVNPHTDYLYWTEGVYEILEVPLDYKPGLEEGMKFYDADSIPPLREALTRALKDGTPFVLETGLTTITGKHLWTEVRGLGRLDGAEQAFVMGTFHDITERKQAEDQLRQLSRAVEQNPASIVIADSRGAIEYANPKFIQTTGYDLNEVLGESFRALKLGNMPARHYEELWKTVRQGREWRGEFQNKKKNGEPYWDFASISPITNSGGQVTHFVAMSEDISERKRLEAFRQALLSLGTKLNGTVNPLGAGHALFEAADQLWQWDSATLHLIAADRHHVQSVILVDTIGGERRELHDANVITGPTPRMQRVMKQGAELLLRDSTTPTPPDSERFGDTARLSASVMCVAIRRETRTVGILSIQSYTPKAYTSEDLRILKALADYCGGALDRIQAEEALRRGEERYRALVETTFDWIWETDAQGRYTYVSPKVRELLGYSPDEVVGRTPFDLMPEKEAERVGAIFGEIAKKQQAFSALENTNRHKDGREVVLETSGVPVLGPNGELRGYRGMDRDITERKRLESQLRQTQKIEAIGQLAGGVAHDFNNILAAIMMHLGLLQMNPNLDDETRQGLNDLDTSARGAAGLTRQLLMFSRRSVLTIKPLDLNEVVETLLKMLRRLIGEHIKLRFDGMSAAPLVEADAGMLEQVLMNLVVNARDAMPKGGRITISTTLLNLEAAQIAENPNRRPGRFVCLSVADTGCGIDLITLKHIFEPFFTTKEAGKGTGLGLATVHGIVAQHRGWVEVDSQVGMGTTFRVHLPAADSSQVEIPQASQAGPIRRGRETILLVEDEQQVRQVVGQSLRALGYQVHEAGNGQEAMILWQTHGPQVDLLLTDMVMPEGMTGLELTEKLQALKPGLKAVISSGYSAEIVNAGVPTKAGIVYLPKPYATKALADVIRDCLDQKQ